MTEDEMAERIAHLEALQDRLVRALMELTDLSAEAILGEAEAAAYEARGRR